MNCTACGKELNYGSRFCSNCGHAVPDRPSAASSALRSPQRIVRPLYGRMIGGVCAGLAQHFGWDVALVRVLLVVLVVLRLRHADPRLLHRLDRHPQRALLVPARALRPDLRPACANTSGANQRPNCLKQGFQIFSPSETDAIRDR